MPGRTKRRRRPRKSEHFAAEDCGRARDKMKDSKEYSKKVRKLYRSLKRKYPKVEKATYEEPAEAVVYAVISENMKAKDAEAAMKHFGSYFVDLNDLRVSRPDEIVEMLGEDTAETREAALRVTAALRWVFNAHHKVSLEDLKRIGKRPARTVLEKTEGMSRFAVDYCVLTALGGHAIPLTARMVEYLRESELVHPEANEDEISGFLTKQIAAKDGYEFYHLLRRDSEGRRRAKRRARTTRKKAKTTKSKPKTKTKTKKKAKTKEKKKK